MTAADLAFLPEWPPDLGPLAWVAVLLLAALVAGEAVRRWLRVSRVLGYLAGNQHKELASAPAAQVLP